MGSPLFPPLAHQRAADEVVSQIEMHLLQGVLRPGDRLPGERELSRQFDVSRPIVREAIKVLEGRGLVTSQHGGGTFVADIIGEVFTPPVRELVSRHAFAAHDYLEFRRAMEGITAERAAERASASDRDLLTGIIDDMRAAHAGNDFDRDAQIDVEFHSAIAECAHNIILMHTLRSCYRLLAEEVFFNRSMIYGLAGARERLLGQHVAIYEAIMAGDGAAARAAAEAHIDFVEAAMREAETSGDRERIAQLRLSQRTRAADGRGTGNGSTGNNGTGNGAEERESVE